MKKRGLLQLVEVEWDDAASTRGWHELEAGKRESGLTACVTVGYLLSYDRECVRVVQHKYDRRREYMDRVGQIMAIPRKGIRQMRRFPVWR